ncbi:MAG TPA: hypothetical protein VFT99_22470, partial [Roseiflexaceae bacterium]|nr:hypothetical protein [Roseiflexaceae bacterium]
MKPKTSFCILSLALGTFTSVAQNTAFTYQGRLADGTGAAAGIYELRFVIYDAATQGNAVGSAMTNSATMVNNGLFTVTLDFGTGVFNGSARWLEIGVRTNGSTEGFTLLAPRHHVAATPHAIFSSTAGIISAGVIQNPTFFGTTGNAPLEIFAGSERALRIEPHNSAAPGLIGGYNLNDGAGHIGAVIAGGGSSAFRNEVQGMYGFIGSGHGGRVGAFAAVVGGANNSALGQYSFIGGGEGNSAAGRYTAVAGGRLNGNTGTYTTVAGGDGNVIQTDNTWSSVGGGRLNLIASNNFSATIAGGERNVVQTNASFAFVGGGLFNTANLEYSSVSGGRGNTSSGRYGTIG